MVYLIEYIFKSLSFGVKRKHQSIIKSYEPITTQKLILRMSQFRGVRPKRQILLSFDKLPSLLSEDENLEVLKDKVANFIAQKGEELKSVK